MYIGDLSAKEKWEAIKNWTMEHRTPEEQAFIKRNHLDDPYRRTSDHYVRNKSHDYQKQFGTPMPDDFCIQLAPRRYGANQEER